MSDNRQPHSDDAFRRLTKIGAQLLEAPVCYLARVGESGSSLFSQHGLPPGNGQLSGKGIGHRCTSSQQPLLLENLESDGTLADAPEAKLGLKAFAAVPIQASGEDAPACLCVADSRARNWTPRQLEILSELAASAERELALRAMGREAARYREQVQAAAARQEKIRSTLAHDLRTPLSIIKLSTHTLTKLGVGDKGEEIIERMQRAANKMAELIDSLLDAAASGETEGSGPEAGEPR